MEQDPKEKAKNNKKADKKLKTHPIRHTIVTILAVLLIIVAVLLNSVVGMMRETITAMVGGIAGTNRQGSKAQQTTVHQTARDLSIEAEQESAVLLMNKDNTLPLSSDVTKVNVFGWDASEWLGGGSGSGGVTTVSIDLLQALTDYGISYNTEITDMYENFQAAREYTSALNSWPEQSSRLYEPSISDTKYYTEAMLDNAKNFSDTAIVAIGRLDGESNDASMEQYKVTQTSASSDSSSDSSSGTGSSDADADTAQTQVTEDDSRTQLDLSTEEIELLTYVGANYDNVIVLINTGNVMALGELETIDGIDAAAFVGYTGQYGAEAIPQLLWGEENFSGRTADTWAYSFDSAPSYLHSNKQGVGSYSNADGLYPLGVNNGNLGVSYQYEQVSYLDYAEGIYVGYRWYETADAEGYFADVDNEYGKGYNGVVQFPFGYGLSYTTFDWTIKDATPEGTITGDDTISVTVEVTNTGDVAGKDVVELYYNPPYIPGEIEKASRNLAAFAKTDLLQPGESQEVTLTLNVEDMASYDAYDSNNNGTKGYELDAGAYQIILGTNAHDAAKDRTLTYLINEDVYYPNDPSTGNEVSNKFTGEDAIDGVSIDGSDSDQDITWLTRADFAGTFPKEAASSREMADNVKALNLYTTEMADAWIDSSDTEPTTGANNGLKIADGKNLTDLGYTLGTDPDNEQWDALLDEITIPEMEALVFHGYSHTASVDSIGKPTTTELDGPCQIGGFLQMRDTTGFPASSIMACSYNTDLLNRVGLALGQEAAAAGINGWYAPATNIHRSPFNGRNYEYYSEDPYLSGLMTGNVVSGAKNAGVYCYIKHFICNDGESYIYRDSIYLWMQEQALREIYLEPFRIAIEDYGATGLMSSYNRIGAVWAGGSEALLTGVLRNEWGFDGAVITDYSDHHQYMNGDQMVRVGGDLWMDGIPDGTLTCETSSNSYKQALRTATKHILYMYTNALATNKDYTAANSDAIAASTGNTFDLVSVVLAIIDILAVLLVVLAVTGIVKDHKIRKQRKKAKQA